MTAWELDDAAHPATSTPIASREVPACRPGFALPETLDDFRVVSVEAEEFSYRMLRDQIASLQSKGVDASESWVDLHLKVALPVASLVLMLVAVPLAARGTRVDEPAGGGRRSGSCSASPTSSCSRSRARSARPAPSRRSSPPGRRTCVFVLIGAYHLLGAD